MHYANVFVANFGKGNFAWPKCQTSDSIIAMDDVDAYRYWEAQDRQGYINYAFQNYKTASGKALTRRVASRWFNLMSIVKTTANDLWLHRDGNTLWWTRSLPADGKLTIESDQSADRSGKPIQVYYKPCEPWSDEDGNGSKLRWLELPLEAQKKF